MYAAVLASIVSLALLSGGASQTAPDLSGTWRFDPNRSDSATYPELSRPISLTINQTATDVRVETARGRGTEVQLAKFADRGAIPTPETGVARWRGATLVIDGVRDIRGQSVTVQHAMTLDAEGRELVVETTVNVQHGYSLNGAKVYGAGRDVFVRAKP